MEEVHRADVESVLRLTEDERPPTTQFRAIVVRDRRRLTTLLEGIEKEAPEVKRSWGHVRRVRHDSNQRSLVLVGPLGEESRARQETFERQQTDATEEEAGISLDKEETEVVSVPSVAPLSAEQARIWSLRYWPVSRGTPAPELMPKFNTEELAQLKEWMRLAWREAAEAKARGDPEMGAVLVDPRSSQRCIASAGSETLTSKSPLRHAVMVAVARVGQAIIAARKSASSTPVAVTASSSPSLKRFKTNVSDEDDREESIAASNTVESSEQLLGSCETYLCTGFDAFMTHEPCAMCAMALLHSRVRRVFWDLPDPKRGALGSVIRLHALPNVNHRYRVFRGFFQDATRCQNGHAPTS